jgi:AraC-like DNA-binding protein
MLPPMPNRFRLSTDQLPPAERFAFWREELFHRNMHMEFVDRSPAGLRFELAAQRFGHVSAGFLRGTPSSYLRTRSHVTDGRDLLSVLIHRAGPFQLETPRGAVDSTLNGAFVMSTRNEFAFHVLEQDCAGWAIYLDRAALQPLLVGVEEPVLHCVTPDNQGLRLLTSYLEVLFSLEQEYDATLASTHIGDLVLSMLGVRGDVQALVRERGVMAARQHAALDSIAKHSAEPGLDPARVAQQLGVSVRYLHRLLEPTGRSFSEHLLEARLDRAAEMLRDPNRAHLRIAEIAAKAGFADISHFNRSFRRAFGDTPYGMRVRTARRTNH